MSCAAETGSPTNVTRAAEMRPAAANTAEMGPAADMATTAEMATAADMATTAEMATAADMATTGVRRSAATTSAASWSRIGRACQNGRQNDNGIDSEF